jgi:serine/threonine protein kinase
MSKKNNFKKHIPGGVKGTLGYLSPEILFGVCNYDPYAAGTSNINLYFCSSIDMWSVGVVLAELLLC